MHSNVNYTLKTYHLNSIPHPKTNCVWISFHALIGLLPVFYFTSIIILYKQKW